MWLNPQEPTKLTPCADLRSKSLGKTKRIVRVRQRLARGVELCRPQPDVRVTPEAAGEHAGCLDRRCLAEPRQGQQRPQREAPAPAVAVGVVLRIAGDFDDGEDRLDR